jgi:DNA end-binding protein Ku
MLRKGDQCPIKYLRVCQDDGKEVPWNEIIKGFKVDDYYVTLTDEDFEKARRERSDSITITEFVRAEEINPRYFEKPYLLEPEKGAGKTYNLLRQAIYNSQMAGLSKFVLRNREHLALLMADENILYLNQMRFHDELRNADVLNIPEAKPAKAELEMAMQLIKGMSRSFEPEKYKDTYEETLRETINAKTKKKTVAATKKQERAVVEDLMAQLKKSLELMS